MYTFIGWASFFHWWQLGRIINLSGVPGTGKTLLSVALSYHLKRLGVVDNVVANFPLYDAGDISSFYTIFLVDEGGVAFNARDSRDKGKNELISDFIFDLGKLDSFAIVPSFLTPDKRLRESVRMFLNRDYLAGRVQEWVWHYGEEDILLQTPENFRSGRLFFVNPPVFWGTYETSYRPPRSLTVDMINRINNHKDYEEAKRRGDWYGGRRS